MAKNANKLTLKEILHTSRPLWWITTAAPFVAGYLVVEQKWSWALALGTLYFAVLYNLMMYGINDIFDYESDIRNPRKTGVLAKSKHLPLWGVIVAGNVPFLAYFAVTGTVASTVWLAVMIFMVVAYSLKGLRFKEVPFLDSFTSSFHYTSPFIFGVLFAGGEHLWLPAFLAFFIWAMANHALGAIQDIGPDRDAGIASIATKLGAEKTLVFCLSAYLVSMALPTIHYGWKGLPVSVVLTWYVGLIITALPFRKHEHHVIYKRMWRKLVLMNYIAGGLVSMYFIFLATQ